MSHRINYKEDLIAEPYSFPEAELHQVVAYQVHGTPADAVRVGLYLFKETPPDIVVSGINVGNNVSICAIYSGTVAACAEGAINGFPAIAFSCDAPISVMHSNKTVFLSLFIFII